MNDRDKIAFTIYLVVILLGIAFGITYLACPTVMPYHHQAIGVNWEDLGPGLQVMLINFVNFAGAGFITGSLSCLIMLLIPFRRGEKWAKWAIPLLLIVFNVFCLYVSATVAAETGASTPWQLSIVILIVVLFAYVLSPGTKKHDTIKKYQKYKKEEL
jgi:hypothetical protein